MARYSQQPQQGVGIAYTPHYDPGFFETAGNVLQQSQQQYDMTSAAQAESMAQYGQEFSFNPDLKNEYMEQYRNDLKSIVDDYGGDIGAARNKIVGRMGEEAANPFWNYNRYQVEQAKIAQELEAQYGGAGNTLWINDPRKADLAKAMESGDMRTLEAQAVQAPDYVGVGTNLMAGIKESLISQGIGIHQVDGILNTLHQQGISGITDTRVQNIARESVEAFKAATANRQFDQRDGFEWVHDDDGIVSFLAGLGAKQVYENRNDRYTPLSNEQLGIRTTTPGTGIPWDKQVGGAEMAEKSIKQIDNDLETFKRLQNVLSGDEDIMDRQGTTALQRLADNPIEKWWQHPLKYNPVTQIAAFTNDMIDALSDPITGSATRTFVASLTGRSLNPFTSSQEVLRAAAVDAADALTTKISEINTSFPAVGQLQENYGLSMDDALKVQREHLVTQAALNTARYPVRDANAAKDMSTIISQSGNIHTDIQYINSDGKTKNLKGNLKDFLAHPKNEANSVSFSPTTGTMILNVDANGNSRDIILPNDILTQTGQSVLASGAEFFEDYIKAQNIADPFITDDGQIDMDMFSQQIEAGKINTYAIGYGGQTDRIFAVANIYLPNHKFIQPLILEITPEGIVPRKATDVAEHVNNALYVNTASTFKTTPQNL